MFQSRRMGVGFHGEKDEEILRKIRVKEIEVRIKGRRGWYNG
jgi:hypothetical protein